MGLYFYTNGLKVKLQLIGFEGEVLPAIAHVVVALTDIPVSAFKPPNDKLTLCPAGTGTINKGVSAIVAPATP